MSLLNHMQSYWDNHLAAGSAFVVSIFTANVIEHLENILWSLLSGLIVFIATMYVKLLFIKIYKEKL